MVRLPRIKIGEGELEKHFAVGSIRKISRVVKYYRKEKLRREQAEIVGIPTAWIDAVNRVELFGNPQGIMVKQCRARGSSQQRDPDAIRNFDFHARLARIGLGHFRDPTRIVKSEKAEVIFRYDADEGHPQFTIEELRNIFGIQFGVVEDGVIEFIHVKDNFNNVNVLWQKFTRFKDTNTKIWDTYARKINELHLRNYGKMKKTSHLDIVAIHEDDDWFYNQNKVREAINNSYDPNYIKSKLEPMIAGTSARGVIFKRIEFPPIPSSPTSVVNLFPDARNGDT